MGSFPKYASQRNNVCNRYGFIASTNKQLPFVFYEPEMVIIASKLKIFKFCVVMWLIQSSRSYLCDKGIELGDQLRKWETREMKNHDCRRMNLEGFPKREVVFEGLLIKTDDDTLQVQTLISFVTASGRISCCYAGSRISLIRSIWATRSRNKYFYSMAQLFKIFLVSDTNNKVRR